MTYRNRKLLDLEDVAAGHPKAQKELNALYACRDALTELFACKSVLDELDSLWDVDRKSYITKLEEYLRRKSLVWEIAKYVLKDANEP